MYVFDSSAIIYGWEQYPIDMFPNIWELLARKQSAQEFQYSELVLTEVQHKSTELHRWLVDNKAPIIELSNEIIQFASVLKRYLEIAEDEYHPKGVDENDLLIIATAKVKNLKLVTNESVQFALPNLLSKYKIPAVCNLSTVEVPTLSFLELLKNYKDTFR